jgi:polysaccharide deacetylase 2 family uncharacterized protein YibQ
MADDLSAPLGRKRTAKPAARLDSRQSRIPLARIAFGVAALLVAGVGARILMVSDPMGGRPVAEVNVNATHNSVAETVSTTAAPTGVITADPETTPGGPAVTVVGDDVPDGTPGGDAAAPNTDGLFPDLLEAGEHGAIPRISASGRTPFEAYARPSLTPQTADGKPLIAIVVTGLGLNEAGTAAAIESLPDTVTLAFAPYGKSLARTAASARAAGHELLLEVPLEPFDYPQSDPGPDTLLTGQPPRDNLGKLYSVMGKFGGYVGLINHMGARFTASAADFAPVMEELGVRGLGYLDDGSSNRSVAQQLATANAVEFGRADMALDVNAARGPILEQLGLLERQASDRGSAIGVISALPVSVATLGEWAKTAAERGYTIVPVSALMAKPS